mgnify:CR=1 FL=1
MDRTNVPVSVYDNLIEAVHQNMDKMHRYVRLRKKLLGVDERSPLSSRGTKVLWLRLWGFPSESMASG